MFISIAQKRVALLVALPVLVSFTPWALAHLCGLLAIAFLSGLSSLMNSTSKYRQCMFGLFGCR